MRKLNVSVLIGVVVAVLGATMTYAYGRTVDRRVVDGRQTVPVLVASTDLPVGTPASDLRQRVRVEQVPSAYAVAGALRALDPVMSAETGRQVLLGAVPKGGQLSRSMFGDEATAGHVNPAAGHVALAVQTDLSPGVARYVTVGQLVDVFVTYRDVRDRDGHLTVASSRTKLFASGIKVLSVSVAQGPAAPAGKDAVASAADPLADKVVAVLDLTPADAERLVNATTLGSIYLAYTADGGHRTRTGVVPDDVVRSNR